MGHDRSGSLPEYSDHSDYYRRFNNSLNPHYMPKYNDSDLENQFELTEPTMSVKTEKKTPTVPDIPLLEQFPFNEDEFSTRSFYQSSPRSNSDNYDLTESDYGELGAQIQNSRLPNLNREPMSSEPNVYYESTSDVRNEPHMHLSAVPGELSPRMLYMPNTIHQAQHSISSQNSRQNTSSLRNINSPRSVNSRTESNPERFFQQGDYNPFFQGRLNFEVLAPVFQDLADLPNVPDLVENEDDDYTQSTSHFVP